MVRLLTQLMSTKKICAEVSWEPLIDREQAHFTIYQLVIQAKSPDRC